MENNRNTILAIVLSLMIILAWQFLYVNPKLDAERRAAEVQRKQIEQSQTAAEGGQANQGAKTNDLPGQGGTQGESASGAAPGSGTGIQQADGISRDAALAKSPRVKFENALVQGSVSLKGARLDDLQLKKYRETIKAGSALITLLSPPEAKGGSFAELGYIGGAELAGDAPGPDTLWSAPEGAKLAPGSDLKLSWTSPKGIVFSRTISLDDAYLFTVRDEIANGSASAANLSAYGRVTSFRKPSVPSNYILHEGPIGVFGEKGLTAATYSGLEDDREVAGELATGGWLGITDKYWAAALVPQGAYKPRFSYFDDGQARWQADFLGDAVSIAPGAKTIVEQRIFAGAKEVAVIDRYEAKHGIKQFELLIDWGWFYFLTKPMFFLLNFLHKLVGNFGVAILAGTIIVKLVLFPLANMSYRSMAQMKKLQPDMMAIRERFADDKVKQQQETMALYKREKINPAAGCWPIAVQIPIFFALYKVLFITIEMRHAPFFGWVQDLAAPDPTSLFNLFGLLPFAVPAFLLIGIWPLIMGVTMFLQMQMNPAPPDPTQAMIFKWMPLVFTFMLASFPAGLVIYWTWNNILSMIQQGVIMKQNGTKIELLDNLTVLFRRKPRPAE